VHVAIAAACLILITASHFDVEIIEYSAVFVFFTTLLAYQFIRIFDNCQCRLKTFVSQLNKQSSTVLLISFISLIGSIYFGFKVGLHYLWILIPSSFLTFWYAIPLFGNNQRVSLRNYPSIKIFSVAFVWSVQTVIFPLQDFLSDPQVWLVFTQRFFLLIALIIPFDIRDMHKDTPLLQTYPQKIGILNSKKIGVMYLLIFFGFSYFRKPLVANSLLSDLFVMTISLLFLVKSSTKQTKYYASFWVESVPIFWWLFLLGLGTLL